MKSRPDARRDGLAAWLACLLPLTGGLPAAAAGDALQPYAARYQVSYRGMSGGQVESSLSRGEAAGQWLYETHAYPNLFGRLAVSRAARERGVMLVTAEGVRPLRFDFDDGSADKHKDVRFTFDWREGRVRGEAAGTPFDLPVRPGTQDTASVQAAMMVELLAGRAPQGYTILTGHRLRDYRYWSEGAARIATPYGTFDTVVWANQRDGSSRVTRVWHAPALGYVPVQAVQYRKGRAEVQMRLVSVERGQAP